MIKNYIKFSIIIFYMYSTKYITYAIYIYIYILYYDIYNIL